jgi:glycosyltransferase involved in cell wall biosynthesis
MNIGIDARGIQDGFKGGVGEYTNQIIQHLVGDSDISIEMISTGLNNPHIMCDTSIVHTHHNIPNKLLNAVLYSISSPHINELFQTNPDIIWMPNWNITSLDASIPLILTVHDLAIDIIPEVFSTRMRYWHQYIKRSQLLHRANTIIAMSESTKRDLIDIYNLSENKIEVIYSGIDDSFYHSRPSEDVILQVKNHYHLPPRYILYLGTIEPRKNVLFLVKAFERIASIDKDIYLVIAGVDGWLYQSIYRYIEQSPYRDRIIRTGYIQAQDKPIIYSQALVFVYPSLYEGFGFPPLEAMASGTPTIVSNNSSFPEIVGNAAYKVSPYDIEELTDIILQLIQDNRLRQLYRERGIGQSQQITWDKTISKMNAIMQKYTR